MPKTSNQKKRMAMKKRKMQRQRGVLPMARTIYAHLFRTVVQTIWSIDQGALTVHPSAVHCPRDKLTTGTIMPTQKLFGRMSIDNILEQGWKKRFQGLFNEIKIHRITAHYLPYASMETSGEYVFALWDADQNADPQTASDLVGMPASVIRPMRVPSKLTWKPTEPEDRNWHKFDDQHAWCSAAIFAFETIYKVPLETKNKNPALDQVGTEMANIAGKVIVEVDLSARGKPKEPQIGDPSSIGSLLATPHCCCKKCLQLANIFSMQSETHPNPNDYLGMDASPSGEMRG